MYLHPCTSLFNELIFLCEKKKERKGSYKVAATPVSHVGYKQKSIIDIHVIVLIKLKNSAWI